MILWNNIKSFKSKHIKLRLIFIILVINTSYGFVHVSWKVTYKPNVLYEIKHF